MQAHKLIAVVASGFSTKYSVLNLVPLICRFAICKLFARGRIATYLSLSAPQFSFSATQTPSEWGL